MPFYDRHPLPRAAETALKPPAAPFLVEDVVALGLTPLVKAVDAVVQAAEGGGCLCRRRRQRHPEDGDGGSFYRRLSALLLLRLLW
jgi:hypothetical protein